jgi:AAA domain-containing protein
LAVTPTRSPFRSATTRAPTRALTAADILVVAPHNLAVSMIAAHVPAGVRVGTADRFQGQETQAVFYAMTCSSGEDVPRGIDFLFNQNRLNVAISRAQCIAVLVHSPRLLDADCRTLEAMELVDGVCRFVELADPVPGVNDPGRDERRYTREDLLHLERIARALPAPAEELRQARAYLYGRWCGSSCFGTRR